MVNTHDKPRTRSDTRRVALSALSAAAAAIGACNAETGLLRTAGGPKTAIRVSVRDAATHEPVREAHCAAETLSRNHPFSLASIMWQTMDSASVGTTDHAGTTRLVVLADRHFRLRVWPRGGPPVVFFHAEPAPLPMGVWLRTDLPPGSDPGIEARIDPAD
jgi:hypothetical protein